MNILYITFDNPATENIISGMRDENLAGLPALYYPFKMLLDRGHTVDLLLLTYQPDRPLVESEHFKREDWTCLGQHKRQPEFPVVTRESRRNSRKPRGSPVIAR